MRIAASLIFFVFSVIFISSFLFIFKISISAYQPILAILLTIGFIYYLFRKEKPNYIFISIATVALIVGCSIFISSVTFDDTFDGNAYHKSAVGALKNGWNPVYESVGDFNKSINNPVKLDDSSYVVWVDHYPKAHWIFGANIYKLTNNIESGRSMVWIVMVALFFMALSYFSTKFGRNKAFLIAFLIAANPIGMTQLFSYYNDGLSGNLIFILILLLTMLIDKKFRKNSYLHYGLIIAVIVMLINLKFTGLVYAGVYCIFYYVFMIIKKDQRVNLIKFTIAGVLALIVGLLIVGLSTYPKNYIENKNPLYPLMGDGKIDIITHNQPEEFNGMNRLTKIFIANFSQTDNVSVGHEVGPRLKVPFTFNIDELSNLNLVDTRIGGYGVLFGGILIVSVVIILGYAVCVIRKRDWQDSTFIIFIPLVSTASFVLLLSDIWWARYFPQMYVLPIVALMILFLFKKNVIANILTYLILFNMMLSWVMYFNGQIATLDWRASEVKLQDKVTQNGKYTPRVFLNINGGYGYSIYDRYGKIEILSKSPVGVTDNLKADSALLSKDIVITR